MMLEVHDLEVRYGPIRAVKRLELSVRDGSVVGLLGAGKSTTLRAISGLVPYTGRILFNGEDCRKLGVEGVVRRGIIHVPEGRRLFSSLTVHENLQVGAAARGGRQAAYEMGDVYELFPALVPLRQRPGWALSGGEQQMVALGRALVAAPRLLLLDEPSLGLSPKLTVTVYRALAEIARATSILLVEQQTALALRICGRATVLSAGVAVLEGTSGELSNRELLMDSYLGQARVYGGAGDAARAPGPDTSP